MRRVVIHPHAGVLSAYGIGLADLRVMREQPVEARLADDLMPALQHAIEELAANGITEIRAQGLPDPRIHVIPVAHLRYEGTDYPLLVDFASPGQMRRAFEATHRQRYGFAFPGRALIVEALSVEVVGDMPHPDEPVVRRTRYGPLARAATVRIYTSSAWWDADVFDREQIQPGDRVVGPAIIIEATATSIVEPGWRAEMTDRSHLVLTRTDPLPNAADTGTGCDLSCSRS
jgi:5-oxoprolinase (ATP-hydrolysing)